LKARHHIQVFERPDVIAIFPIGGGAVFECAGVGRIELYRLAAVRYGTVIFVLGDIGVTAVIVSGRVVRIELDRLVVVQNGALIIPLCRIRRASVVEG